MKSFRAGDLVRIRAPSTIQFVDDKNVTQSSGQNKKSLVAMALGGRLGDPSKVLVWLVLRQERCVVDGDDVETV